MKSRDQKMLEEAYTKIQQKTVSVGENFQEDEDEAEAAAITVQQLLSMLAKADPSSRVLLQARNYTTHKWGVGILQVTKGSHMYKNRLELHSDNSDEGMTVGQFTQALAKFNPSSRMYYDDGEDVLEHVGGAKKVKVGGVPAIMLLAS